MNEDKDNEINELKERISCLEAELHETQTHLKKYTAPASRQVYYERHKEKEKQRSADYRAKTNYKATPEQTKLYNQRSYQKRKQKQKEELDEKETNDSI